MGKSTKWVLLASLMLLTPAESRGSSSYFFDSEAQEGNFPNQSISTSWQTLVSVSVDPSTTGCALFLIDGDILNSDETYNKNFRVYDSSSSTELGSTIVNNGYLQMHTGFSVMACGISESAASTIDIQWEAQNAGDTSSTGSTGVWTVYAWYE